MILKFCQIKSVDPILKNPKKWLSEENPLKAYRLIVDTGTETINVVSAIVDLFSPEDLLNKVVAFDVDLDPKEIRGFISKGMICLDKDKLIEGKLGELCDYE